MRPHEPYQEAHETQHAHSSSENGSALQTRIERRVRAAFDRFEAWLATVDVVFADLNRRRGGVDTSCRLLVRGPRLDDIVVEQRGANIHYTVTAALDRAASVVVRAKARSRDLISIAAS